MPASLAFRTVAATEALASAPVAPLPLLTPVHDGAPSLGLKLRSRTFNALFLGYTFCFVLAAYPLLLWPSRRPIARAMKVYALGVLWLMRRVAGIRVDVRGRENLPKAGAYILAGKHQSEADGLIQMALVDDLAFVAMKEVGEYPLVGPVLRKLEMVLVDTDGGARERTTLTEGGRKAAAAGRPILIYPEGTLMEVGARGKYRSGIYYLAADLGLPVIPVATDVGRCWDRRQPIKRAGTVAVSFLPALSAGTDKRTFMAALEATVEAESARLAAECFHLRADSCCGAPSFARTRRRNVTLTRRERST